MTSKEMVELFIANDIQHEIIGGKLMALYKMSDFKGNDASEWIEAEAMADIINYQY